MKPIGFHILDEDGPFLIVSKPGGVLTQAPPEIDSMEVRVKRYLKERDSREGRVYVGVPHRLDRPVSGAMVFGTNARSTARLSEQFRGRLVEKTYWALVEGDVHPDQGTWTDYLRKVPGQARSEVVDAAHAEGRDAVLHYQVLERRDGISWLQIELETGRTHQIRVQAAWRGHAIIGDEFYGASTPFGPETFDQRQRWIGLHARTLSIGHPKTRERIEATAPLSEHWRKLAWESILAADAALPRDEHGIK